MNNTSSKYYRIKIWSFGIIPVLLLYNHFIDIEEYEECQKILDAIKEHEDYLGEKIGTVVNEYIINKVISDYLNKGIYVSKETILPIYNSLFKCLLNDLKQDANKNTSRAKQVQ